MDGRHRKAEGYNPLCGDRLKLYVKMENGVVKDASFEGAGCAISTASASLMTESLKGKTREEALELLEHFHDLLTKESRVSRGTRQAGGVLRRARLPGARQVRHAVLAHPEIGARRRGEKVSTE